MLEWLLSQNKLSFFFYMRSHYQYVLLFIFYFVGTISKSLYRKEVSLFPRKGSKKLISDRARFIIPRSSGSSNSNGSDSDQTKAHILSTIN